MKISLTQKRRWLGPAITLFGVLTSLFLLMPLLSSAVVEGGESIGVHWSEEIGGVASAPACVSANVPASATCNASGQAVVTLNWNEVGFSCMGDFWSNFTQEEDITLSIGENGGGDTRNLNSLPCTGSYTFSNLIQGSTYTYTISFLWDWLEPDTGIIIGNFHPAGTPWPDVSGTFTVPVCTLAEPPVSPPVPPSVPPPASLPQCSDGIDNDGDGKIDLADPGCDDLSGGSEVDPLPPPQCSDGIDNDGDGKIDYPSDPGCTNSIDDNETNPSAIIDISASPPFVKEGESTLITWSAEGVESCAVSGPGVSVSTVDGNPPDLLDGVITGSQGTSDLDSESVYTLSCIGLDTLLLEKSITVRIIPNFEEI